jgi:hypothetical protein
MTDDYMITTYSDRPHTAAQFFEDHKRSYEIRSLNYQSAVSDRCHSLTILIPSCAKHKESTDLLIKELDRQKLKYLVDRDECKDLGTKRQDLYAACDTDYSLQFDADDWITADFSIVLAPYLRLRPDIDCINFIEHVVMGNQKTITRRSINFPWSGMMMGPQYCFSPNTKSIIRTELARQVEFEKGHQGEDLAFGRDLRPLLKSEINLDYIGYYYEYSSEGSATQTNEHQIRR